MDINILEEYAGSIFSVKNLVLFYPEDGSIMFLLKELTLILKMQLECSPETLVSIYKTIIQIITI
jgi:hypothetical protein